MQAAPNPFADVSVISFDIENPSNVTLKIYNELGTEITTLVNGMKESGHYEVRFNASGLPQGSYYYRLQVGDNIESDKLILVK